MPAFRAFNSRNCGVAKSEPKTPRLPNDFAQNSECTSKHFAKGMAAMNSSRIVRTARKGAVREAIAKEKLARIFAKFKDDDDAILVLEGLREGWGGATSVRLEWRHLVTMPL